MAVICCTLIATFLVYFSSFSSPVKGELEIVPPFPGQPVVIEGEKMRIPCAAQDLGNVTKPHKMTFYKVVSRYGDIRELQADGKITFDTKFYMNGWRIMSYLVIHNMTEALKGRYECHAARPQDGGGIQVPPAKYGFNIVYIPKAALPSLNHSKNVTTEFGKPASLYCQVVPAKVQVSTNLVKLDKIAWYRNNLLPDRELTALQDKLPNINLTIDDGGTYTCRLDTTLGLSRQYNITGIVEVRSPEENPTTGSSAERNKFHSFLVLITGVVTWLLCKKT